MALNQVVEREVQAGKTWPPSPAAAYYNQRKAIAQSSPRLKALREVINDPLNLSAFQWAQWFAYTREYRPDVVLELGRGNGNSTAAVNEALHQLGHGRLVSFCLSTTWDRAMVPKIAPLVEPDWFDRVDARVGDMLVEDFRAIVGDARRVLVIWDAHGYEIAELMLAHILPVLAEREHFVIMHDISDLRYLDPSFLQYGDRVMWQGMEKAYTHGRQESRLCLGWISTLVDQAIAIVDFLTRNRTELRSADESFHTEIVADPDRQREMAETLSADDWSAWAHWAYFSLNGVPGPYTFPRLGREVAAPGSAAPIVPAARASSPFPDVLELTPTRELVKIVARRVRARFLHR